MLNLGGEPVELSTNYGDQLTAERAIGESPLNTPINLQAHVWYSAFRRANPEHPAGRTFRGFVDNLWGAEDLDEAGADDEADNAVGSNGLDPTPVAATEG
jgi:hypothetical protein